MDNQTPPAAGMLPVNPLDLPDLTTTHQAPATHDFSAQQSHSSESATMAMPASTASNSGGAEPATTAHKMSPTDETATMPTMTAEPLPQEATVDKPQPTELTVQTQSAPAQTEPHPPATNLESPADQIAVSAVPAAPLPTQLPAPPVTSTPQTTSRPTSPTKQASSGASSPLSYLSSPLSERSSFTDDAPEFSPNKRARLAEPFKTQHVRETKPLIDCAFERDGAEGEGVLRLKPTAEQWADFPAILQFARHHGARDDGCFKVSLPDDLKDPLPEKPKQNVACNAYRPKRLKNNFWRVSTGPGDGTFSSTETGPEFTDTTQAALQKLKKLFCKNIDRRIRDVRYRPDVPAWTPEQRRRAGVPERSPVHPLKGDELDFSRAIIPGIHTPYVYESAVPFGATFQIHAEDFKLISLNHLYKGRKIWIVIPSTSIDAAEVAFGRKNKCAQFMRHRAEFIFPDKLKQMGVPHRIIDQRPGETVVILPDAYHQGFSTGYTLAEAKNYADADWMIDEYQPCRAECQLATAIPEMFMRPVGEGETRLDLCARYDDAGNWVMPPAPQPLPQEQPQAVLESAPAPAPAPAKRGLEISNEGGLQTHPEMESKRVKVE